MDVPRPPSGDRGDFVGSEVQRQARRVGAGWDEVSSAEGGEEVVERE